MKKRLKFIILSLFIVIYGSSIYAASVNDEHYQDLCENISGNKYTGDIIKPKGTKSYSSIASTYQNKELDNYDESNEYKYLSSVKISNGYYWFTLNGKYYLVKETNSDPVSYYDETKEKDIKVSPTVYSIPEDGYVKDTTAVIYYGTKYYAYWFDEDGVCSDAITNSSGVKVEFKSSGEVSKGYDGGENFSISSCGLDIYTNDSFEGTKGVIDKSAGTKLYNGYWILDKENEKYDLYKASSTGSSSTVSGATGKNAYELYTIITNKNYTTKATTSKNSSNSTTNSTSITKTTVNTNATVKEKLSNIAKTSVDSINNKFTITINNGKLKLTPKTGTMCSSGEYYCKNLNISCKIGTNGQITEVGSNKTATNKDNCEIIDWNGVYYLIIK